MKTSLIIKDKIDRLPKGYVFTCADFLGKVKSKEALIKALNRLAVAGGIVKLAKGKYYKPEKSPFGELSPSQYQIVKDLIEVDGKLVGYLTGLSIYNTLGLTTQVSNVIQIGKNDTRPPIKREKYTISFVKQKNTITKENTPLLQLLDALRFIKKIPDLEVSRGCHIVLGLVAKLSGDEQGVMIRLAMKYPPSTRAFLGALLTDLDKAKITGKLRNSLNPITSYKIPGVSDVLSSAIDWNIK